MKDSYAVEGIFIDDHDMYILNDGYYHNAKVPVNCVNHYRINNQIKFWYLIDKISFLKKGYKCTRSFQLLFLYSIKNQRF